MISYGTPTQSVHSYDLSPTDIAVKPVDSSQGYALGQGFGRNSGNNGQNYDDLAERTRKDVSSFGSRDTYVEEGSKARKIFRDSGSKGSLNMQYDRTGNVFDASQNAVGQRLNVAA